MKKLLSYIVFIILAVLVPFASGFAAGPVIVEQSGATTRISNNYLERTLRVEDGVVGTTQFLNKLSGRAYSVCGDEFQITLTYERVGYHFADENPLKLTNKNFKVDGESVKDLADGGKRVTYRLSMQRRFWQGPKLEVDLIYQLLPSEFYMRQWLKLKTVGAGTLFIDKLAVAKDHWSVQHVSLGGFGQPLFADDLFMGLEYPASINTGRHSAISLKRYVGMDIPATGYTSDPAVIGVADNSAGLHQAFMQYVSRMRAAPVRPYLLYNTWYDLRRPDMTQQNTLERLHQLREFLLKPYDLHLNAFVLDEGWDDVNKLWAINPQEFPDGFGNLVAALKAASSSLGLWFSPMGGYNHLAQRIAAGRQIGMEVTSDDLALCLAGHNYSRFFRERVLHLEKKYGVDYYKFDGTPMGCNTPNGGYPLGVYSREANIRSLIDTAKALRAENPKVFLNFTNGMWSSPWWLRWADTVPILGGNYGGDYGYLYTVPTLSPRQSAISYHNMVLYDVLVKRGVQFPISSMTSTGLIQGLHCELGGKNESLKDWDDAVVDYLTNGNMMIQMYITPGLLKPDEWAVLGHSLQWYVANAHPLLDNSTMVLGDPAKRQPYGYVHYSRAKTIISMRNPYVKPQSVSLKLGVASGFRPSTAAWTAEVLYPYRAMLPGNFHFGGTLRTELGAYELKVIELRPVKKDRVRISGVRYALETSPTGKVNLRLYAPAGATRTVSVQPTQIYQNVRVDGKPVDLSEASNPGSLKLHFGKLPRPDEPSFTEPAIAVHEQADGARTARVSLAVDVPRDFNEAKLALLYEPFRPEPGVTAEARDNGKPAPVQTVRQHASRNQIGPSGKSHWYFFTLPLSPGRHAMDFTIQIPKATTGRITLSGWLLGKRALASHTLQITLKPGDYAAAPHADRLPHPSAIKRETYALFSRPL